MVYSLVIVPSAQKQTLPLPKEAQVEVAQAIVGLRDNPRPARCKKLHDTGLWRIRVKPYRVVYDIDDDAQIVTVLKVAPRREDTYKSM